MKKLFIIEIIDDLSGDYDEFDGFVIRASDEDTAWKMAKKLVRDCSFTDKRAEYFNKESFSIKELSATGEAEIILASYNAG